MVMLAAGLPSVDELFAFARDAEHRFDTLRLRIEDRRAGATGAQVVAMDVALAHPGQARIVTSEPALGTAANADIWLSDGETVRTYSARHRLATERPVRPRVRGLDDADLPETSRVYRQLTALEVPSLADTFVHPAGFCQNVLATGRCWISGTDVVAGREAVILECDHPRTTQLPGDRPDYHLQVAFDRVDGVITRLVETIAGQVTREATVVAYATDVVFPDGTFELSVPAGTNLLY
jgi:outer membrane lipoprotein-sorting protein